jgi:integrase
MLNPSALKPPQNLICMKGSIHYRRDRNYWFVAWYYRGKVFKINRYKGFLCRDGEFAGLKGKGMAARILSLMQSDEENGTLRIEKYTRETPTDVIPYLKSWLSAQRDTLSPATYKDYENSIKNHLCPWFEKHPFQLHEIRYDNLCELLRDIKREGKGKLNTMYCLHKCLDHAFKSDRIPIIPPFPERERYRIEEKEIKWLPEDRQIKIIKAIPEEHQPIFWWLKFHLRRPSEAMALFKEDYDKERDCFVIRRAFSSKKLVDHTKTHKIHHVPCHSEFRDIMAKMPRTFSPFFFVNSNGRLTGHHYQHDFLVDLWNRACKEVGEDIRMYAGLKHSSCTQYIAEKGLSVDELQMITEHARRASVLRYAAIPLEAKRRLMMREKVVKLGKVWGKDGV